MPPVIHRISSQNVNSSLMKLNTMKSGFYDCEQHPFCCTLINLKSPLIRPLASCDKITRTQPTYVDLSATHFMHEKLTRTLERFWLFLFFEKRCKGSLPLIVTTFTVNSHSFSSNVLVSWVSGDVDSEWKTNCFRLMVHYFFSSFLFNDAVHS